MIYYIKRFFDPLWWKIKRMSDDEYWNYVDDNIYDDWTDED